MKVVLSILIWIIIALVVIWGTKSIIQNIKTIRNKKNHSKKSNEENVEIEIINNENDNNNQEQENIKKGE